MTLKITEIKEKKILGVPFLFTCSMLWVRCWPWSAAWCCSY